MYFAIDGQDFTDCLKMDGLGWTRNDLDADGAGRNLGGLMNRKRIATKRKLSVALGIVVETRLRILAEALNKQYVSVTYDDLQYGRITRTFYGAELSALPFYEQDEERWYKDGAFNLTER